MGFGSKLKSAVKKVVKQTVTNARNLPQFATELGQIGAAPVALAAGTISGGLTAAAPVLGQATSILQANPLLGQAIAGATGLPLGGLFSGPTEVGGGGGGAASTPFAPVAADDPSGTPMWVWIAAGGAALLGLVFLLRRKD